MMQLKKRKAGFYLLIVLLVMPFLMMTLPEVCAQEGLDPLIILSPGSTTKTNFYIDGIFNIRKLRPAASTLVVALASGDVNPGTLKFTLEYVPQKTEPFLFEIGYNMIGFVYAFGGIPEVIIESSDQFFKLIKSVDINSNFGLAAVSFLVSSLNNPGNFQFPAAFTLTIELSAATSSSE